MQGSGTEGYMDESIDVGPKSPYKTTQGEEKFYGIKI
jgi:hypothetical protein